MLSVGGSCYLRLKFGLICASWMGTGILPQQQEWGLNPSSRSARRQLNEIAVLELTLGKQICFCRGFLTSICLSALLVYVSSGHSAFQQEKGHEAGKQRKICKYVPHSWSFLPTG